ncbi:NADPH-dependent diflavin oxidoreductase 1 [Nymphon striatum]|nr:NADPH-dependent diflavin oxidoreductase 1 [Nymphon striatum]
MDRNLTILYGSQTGTAQEVGESLGRTAKRFRFNVIVSSMDDYDIMKLVNETLVVFVCSTTGQGETPDNMNNFWKFLLRRNLPNTSLLNLNFAVVGLGDSAYLKFNFVAKRLQNRLLQLGGTSLLNPALADDQHDLGPDGELSPWLKSLWNILMIKYPLPEGLEIISPDILPIAKFELLYVDDMNGNVENYDHKNSNYREAAVISCERVTSLDHFQDVRLVKLDIKGCGFQYKPGDVAVILPNNLRKSVNSFLEIFPNFNFNRNFVLKQKDPNISVPHQFTHPMSLEECIFKYMDIQAVPRRYFFEILKHFTESELEREKFEEFNAAEGQEELFNYCNRPHRTITEALADFPRTTPNIPISYLFDLIPFIQSRSFSIASSYDFLPNEVHLLVAVVEYKTIMKEPRRGLCSNWLASLSKGDVVPLKIKSTNSFCFPKGDEPVIMVGPGTGVAPFRSFIQERMVNNIGKNYLFFGCRNEKKDYFCADEWRKYAERGLLTVFTAFSRDQDSKIYVQNRMLEHSSLIWKVINDEKGYFYIAGNAKQMPDDVNDALKTIIQTEGGLTESQSDSYQTEQYFPDKYSYTYHEEFTGNYIRRIYFLQEMSPQSAFLCPKNSFISKVHYSLVQKLNESFTHELGHSAKEKNHAARDICPTLSRCLGHQACLFNFGLEFCGWDPLPGERKLINVTIECYHDKFLEQLTTENAKFPQKKDQVINLAYKSRLEEGNSNYSNIIIKPYILPENEIFVVGCAELENISSLGYRGICLQKPQSNISVTEELWHVLARYFFEILKHFTESELEREKFEEFNAAEGQEELFNYCNRPHRTITEALADFPRTTPNIPISYLFDLIPFIQSRSFSIASSYDFLPNEVHLLVAVVEYKTIMKEPRRGLCSNWLASLSKGDVVPLKIKSTNSFCFPKGDEPVIMVGPGTGVAPFRSFIQERMVNNIGKNYLFFGCRNEKKDYFCADEWRKYAERGLLTVFTAFSRDQDSKIYVQNRMLEHSSLIWKVINDEKGYFYIAGNAKQMPDDVNDALKTIIQTEGGLTESQSDSYQTEQYFPDKYSYTYHEEFTGNYIRRIYFLQEMSPQSAFLCPKNSFISKVHYSLVQKLNESFTHELGHSAKEKNHAARDICPTLSRCLGHQACLFNFGLEFCGWDPLPGERKLINVTIECYHDKFLEQLTTENAKFPQKKDQVINLAYKSRLEEGNSNYSNIIIKPYILPENEIFVVGCAELENISSLGYRGICLQKPQSNISVTEELWHVLARAQSKTCRKELLQVYCAIQYNGLGHCVPPQFVNHEDIVTVGVPQSLVPVRLAFCILLHNGADAVVQLFHLIHRPEHFYVIHVDIERETFRKELEFKLGDFLRNHNNVRILPRERSFSCSWGSFEILRAELECFEELLRMGTWDFVINLSGADLPLRNVDDLAAALATQRGNILIPHENVINSVISQDSDHYTSVMYCCGRFVYNVTKLTGLPKHSELKLYMGAAWGVFCRDFIAFVLDTEKRGSLLNKNQFFMQLMIIPDEFYLVTTAFNSEFMNRIRTIAIHSVKPFKGNNDLNLCRHIDDADFCGQGPDTIIEEDVHMIADYPHERFFMRKFQTSKPNSNERLAVIDLMDHYYQIIQQYIPPVLIKQLAENVIKKKFGPDNKLISVIDVKVFPNLLPSDKKCGNPFYGKVGNAANFKFWLDFIMETLFLSNKEGEKYGMRMNVKKTKWQMLHEDGRSDAEIKRRIAIARTTLQKCRIAYVTDNLTYKQMKPNSEEETVVRASLVGENVKPAHSCFIESHLQMIYATTWTVIDPVSGKTGLESGVPIPYSSVQESVVWINLYFNVDDEPTVKNDSKLKFENLNVKNVSSLPLKIKMELSDYLGSVVCSDYQEVVWNEQSVSFNEYLPYANRTEMVWPTKLSCAPFKSGMHTLSISKAGVKNPEIYNLNLYLLDSEHVEHELIDNDHLKNVANLWSLQDASVISTKKVKRKIETNSKTTASMSDISTVACSLPSFSKWLFCCGGFLTLFFGGTIFVYWFSTVFLSPGSLRRNTKKKLINFLIIFILVIIIQMYMFNQHNAQK